VTRLAAADLYCGGGGTSHGAEQTGAVEVQFAVNHWDVAIKTHQANFPKTQHVLTDLARVRPSECGKIRVLYASPECTHHSRARGGVPTTDQQRSGPWDILPWVSHHRPSFVFIENVIEFEDWGPIGDNGRPIKSLKGRIFQAWVMAIESMGYRVEWRRLNAADFGAATSRVRLFLVARKGTRRIKWPEPSHLEDPVGMLPGLGAKRWRGVIEVIDWRHRMDSVFARNIPNVCKRPLVDNTIERIIKGLERHVSPTIVTLRNNGRATDMTSPIGTVTAGGWHHGVSVPFVATVNHGDSGGSRTRPADVPLPTITTTRGDAIVAPLVAHYGTVATPLMLSQNTAGACKTMNDPVPTITTGAGSQIFVPFIVSFYGTKNDSAVDSPTPTITTVDRHTVVAPLANGYPQVTPRTDGERKLVEVMRRLGIVDIGFRMMQNDELARAQGFPSDYIFHGTKKDVTRQIGNSVSPDNARALTESVLG
jgi:DNA (cytosine-5)-methyltransferase 1